ncbi:MAG: trypsin-like serine protease, partial [Bdellovibrionales bacterium]|nr:trypsin-like serine protease [Bdellovibrionales bacterium]
MEHMLGMVFWVLLGSLAGSVSFAAPSYPSAIYGDDGRRDLHEVTHRPSQLAAAASVALFQRENLRRTKSGLLRVEGKTYGEEQGLCRGERFFDQPAGAFCSGVVVGPELVLTAAHCLSSARCEDLRLAFGYAKLSESHEPRELLPEDVLECREILRFKTKLDFALIRTSGRAPE